MNKVILKDEAASVNQIYPGNLVHINNKTYISTVDQKLVSLEDGNYYSQGVQDPKWGATLKFNFSFLTDIDGNNIYKSWDIKITIK